MNALSEIDGTNRSQVTESLEELSEAVTQAGDVMQEVEERLGCVLLPETPVPTKGEAGAEVDLVPIASEIRSTRRRVELIIEKGRSILGRLEI